MSSLYLASIAVISKFSFLLYVPTLFHFLDCHH